MAKQVAEEPWIGGPELAKDLGRPESTIRLWTKQGLIPAIRMPGNKTRYLYQRSEVRAALRGYTTSQPA